MVALLGLDSVSAQTLAPGVTLVPVAPGYASVAINDTSFTRHNLVSLGTTQYIAFYSPTTNVTVGRRTLGTTSWELKASSLKPSNAGDAHDVVSIGIGSDGFLHCSWGMHAETLHYARSASAWSLTLVQTTMTGAENTVTYPQFFQCPNGDVLFHFREGASGAGDTYLNRWSSTKHSWTNVNFKAGQQPYIKGTTGNSATDCNAYPNFQCFDSHTNLVVTWVWRASASTIETCHDTLYARSPDYGVTWLKYDGTPYTLPITRDTADNIWPIALNHTLMNQNGQCIDTNGRPVIALWYAPGCTGTPIQYHVIWNDGEQWRTNQVGNRVGTSADAWPKRPIVVCDKANRLFMVFTDPERGYVPTLAWTSDPNRAAWNFANLTSDYMGTGWEPTYDPVVWERDGKLHMLYQCITGVTGGTPISVLQFDPAVFLASPLAPPPSFIWTNAAGGNWSTPSNWLSNTPPPVGGFDTIQLQFSAATTYAATNDLPGGFLLNQLSLVNNTTNDLAGSPLVFTDNTTNLPALAQSGGGTTRIFSGITLGADTTLTVAGALTLAGPVSGPGGLAVSGGGTLTLAGSNTYAGPTTLNSGTVVFGSQAFGTNTLNLAGGTLRWQTGCTDDICTGRAVNLNGTTTFDPNGNAPLLSGSLAGLAGMTLQASSGGTLTLGGNNLFSGAVALIAGTLIAAHPNALGTTASQTVPGNSATSSLGLQGGITLGKPLVFSGRQPLPNPSAIAAHLVNISGTNTLAADITCTTGGNQYNIESAAGLLVMAGGFSQVNGTGNRYLNLQGAGDANWTGAINNGTATFSVVKRGSGRWTLSGTNGYTGTNLVTEGTLLVNGIVGTNVVIVTNATLGGRGVILGPVTVQNGATLSPGASLGRLTISNSLTLQPTSVTFMELNAAAGTNDQVVCSGPIAYGGTLSVTNLAGTLVAGNAFKLFTTPSASGNYGSILSAIPGYDCRFSFNPANGVLTVVSSVATSPANVLASVVGGTLQLSWPADHTGWRLQAQTNAPGAGLGTNWFDVPAAATTNRLSLPMGLTSGSGFYRLVYP